MTSALRPGSPISSTPDSWLEFARSTGTDLELITGDTLTRSAGAGAVMVGGGVEFSEVGDSVNALPGAASGMLSVPIRSKRHNLRLARWNVRCV